jgi:hypothetical protein
VTRLPLLLVHLLQTYSALNAQVLHVSPDGAYSSIGKAVADAQGGATIRVAPGMYVGIANAGLVAAARKKEVTRAGSVRDNAVHGMMTTMSGSRVRVRRYHERLVISKRVRIVADGSGPVTLAWSTTEPYQSAIESQGLHGASVSGLTIRHRSPSVANNYAVFLQVRITWHIPRPIPLHVAHSFGRCCRLPHRPELEVYYTTLL